MPPGRKRGTGKAPEAEPPLTKYERQRAQTMMRNNQVLRSLGVTTLASILNSSSAKKKAAAREDSGSLYEPQDIEGAEDDVVDQMTVNTVMSTGGARGSKRISVGPVEQEQPVRMTRQRTKELTSIEEGLLDTTTSVQQDSLPAQVDEQEQMCNEGESSSMANQRSRGRSMGKDLERMCRGLNTKIPVVIAEGKRRPEVPMQAAKLASEGGIILRQHIPIYTHWKEYKKDEAPLKDYMGKVAVKFTMDTNNSAVKSACTDLLKSGQRQMRHKLKKNYFDDVPANQVRTTSPMNSMTDEQWKTLVTMWSNPKHKERCLKAKVSRKEVKYPHKTGSRYYLAQTYAVKQDKYKDEPPTAIDLFEAFHCSRKTGCSVPVKEAIAQMVAIVVEPPEEGQASKTPAEAVAQVLPSTKFLRNAGLEIPATKKSSSACAQV